MSSKTSDVSLIIPFFNGPNWQASNIEYRHEHEHSNIYFSEKITLHKYIPTQFRCLLLSSCVSFARYSPCDAIFSLEGMSQCVTLSLTMQIPVTTTMWAPDHHDYDVIIIIKICVHWKWIQFMQQKIPERTIFHIGSVNPTHHTPLRTHSTICNNAQEAWTENKNMFSIYSNRIRCVVLYTLTKYYVTQKLNFFSALLKSTRRVKCALKSKHWHVKRTF